MVLLLLPVPRCLTVVVRDADADDCGDCNDDGGLHSRYSSEVPVASLTTAFASLKSHSRAGDRYTTFNNDSIEKEK